MIGLAELKQHLRVTHTRDDAYIAELEAAAVEAVAQYEGAVLGEPAAQSEFHRGSGTRDLWLDAAPVTGGEITVIERAYPGGDAVELGTDDFTVRGSSLVRLGAGNRWQLGYEYQVDYQAGYAEGEAPYRLQRAVAMLVALWYGNRTPVASGGAVELPLGVKLLLKRRVRVS